MPFQSYWVNIFGSFLILVDYIAADIKENIGLLKGKRKAFVAGKFLTSVSGFIALFTIFLFSRLWFCIYGPVLWSYIEVFLKVFNYLLW